MKIYKILVKNNYSHPMFFLVNSISEIENIYRRKYPDGLEIMRVEFLSEDVIMGENNAPNLRVV